MGIPFFNGEGRTLGEYTPNAFEKAVSELGLSFSSSLGNTFFYDDLFTRRGMAFGVTSDRRIDQDIIFQHTLFSVFQSDMTQLLEVFGKKACAGRTPDSTIIEKYILKKLFGKRKLEEIPEDERARIFASPNSHVELGLLNFRQEAYVALFDQDTVKLGNNIFRENLHAPNYPNLWIKFAIPARFSGKPETERNKYNALTISRPALRAEIVRDRERFKDVAGASLIGEQQVSLTETYNVPAEAHPLEVASHIRAYLRQYLEGIVL
jgi:hypothetical protein